MRKPLPKGLDIEFEGGLEEAVTVRAGVALLIELGRISGVISAAERCLRAKKSSKGQTRPRAIRGVLCAT